MYAIVLSDSYDPTYTTFHTFSDQRIWDQLHSLIPPATGTSWSVPLPSGVLVGDEESTEAHLTIGSFENDYALCVARSNAMTLLATDPATGYAALTTAGIDAEHTYEGLYY